MDVGEFSTVFEYHPSRYWLEVVDKCHTALLKTLESVDLINLLPHKQQKKRPKPTLFWVHPQITASLRPKVDIRGAR